MEKSVCVKSKKISTEAQKARERRANQTPEEIAARRRKDAQRARERRARLSEEQIAAQRRRDAILKRQRRANETDAEKAIRRSLEAHKARDRRAGRILNSKRQAAANRMGLTHFMVLAERTDLRCDQNVNDPLCLPNSDGTNTDWIKQEVNDDFSGVAEMCDPPFTNIPVKIELHEESNAINLGNESRNVARASWEGTDNPQGIIKRGCKNIDSGGTNVVEGNSGMEVAKSHPRSKPYYCDVCGKLLSCKGNMRLHKIKRHGIKMPFICRVCNETFDFRRDVVRHRNEVHRRKSDGMFECERCGKVTLEFHNFLTHLKVHAKPDVEERKNKSCSEKQVFICEQCGKAFKRNDTLKTHRFLVHLVDGGAKAEKYKKKFQQKNYECGTCKRRFAFRCLLDDHVNIHSGLRPYACKICGRGFAQRASLQQHKKKHLTIRPFPCPECEFAFYVRGDLTKHMRKHTGERPFVCEVCGESYAQSSHLNVHKRSHTGERPFKCDICSRGFTKSSDVVRHRRIHTGELPFLCQVCGKSFRQSAQCRNHIKNHHPEAGNL